MVSALVVGVCLSRALFTGCVRDMSLSGLGLCPACALSCSSLELLLELEVSGSLVVPLVVLCSESLSVEVSLSEWEE